jgi:RNA polymerase sigma-70 factor, ECF subfamily
MSRYAPLRVTPPLSESPSSAEDLARDRELVRRCRSGDEEAFRELVTRHHARVFRLCRLRTDDESAAEELTQDVFVRVHRALGGFRGEAALGTWIYRIAINLCRDRERRNGRRRAFTLVPLPTLGGSGEEVSRAPGPDDGALAGEAAARLRSALGGLRPELREALELRYFAELSYAEIAAAMGCELGTVSSRLSRGLERLGEMLRTGDGRQEGPDASRG